MKLKIHFLEEHLNKTKPEFNQAARQENVDLKVSNLTMTRDVHKYKKMFRKVEQERDACQLQIEELRDKAKRKYADDELKKELDLVMEELEQKNERIQALEEELNDARDVEAGRIQELTDEVAELQYLLREKERTLDDKDEVIEAMQQKDESPLVAELEGKLEKMKSQVKDLQESLERAKSAAEDSRTAKREADEKRERAMEDLRQLQDDVANKSITTKGLNRQLEDKAEQLKTQLDDLRRTHSSLQHTLNDESEDKAELERRVREFEKALSAQREKIGSLESERDSAKKERDNASELLRRLEHELDDEGEAKGLLKSRHDAVSAESEQLRHEHERTKEAISELEDLIDSERVQSASQIEDLRSQHRDEVEQLGDEIDVLKHDLEDKLGQHAAEEDRWDAARRTLELAREKAEQQATTLQRTVDRLQSAESSMSGRERRLQDVLDGERQRYHGEQELLSRQIGELNDDIAHRRQTAETQRLELLGVREELRASRRDETALRDRVQALEDEVAVLQATLEEEQERNRGAARAGVDEQLVERQRQQAARDKQAARDQLAAVTRDARVLRAALADVEAERDELRSQLDSLQQAQSTSANPDRCTPRKLDQRREQETLDLRKAKLRLEAELTRLRDELQSGAAVRAQLARELDDEVARAAAEENRLAAELDRRGDALERVTEGRDRELVAARARAERLQQRVTELEAEVHALLVGDGKSGEDDTELELNRQPQRQLEAEVRTIRGQLADARRAVRELRRQTRRQGEQLAQQAASIISANNNNQNQTVSTTGDGIGPEPTSTAVLDQDERRHLHGLLKAATLEAESLSAALAERDARAGELRVRLRRVREDERARLADKMERMAERVARERERAAEAEERIKREREREKERAREKGKEREKGRGAQEEDEEKMRQQVQQQHARELRGLSKEIVWLRARAERERRFREDLAWSKGLMELRERVRVAWYVPFSSWFFVLSLSYTSPSPFPLFHVVLWLAGQPTDIMLCITCNSSHPTTIQHTQTNHDLPAATKPTSVFSPTLEPAASAANPLPPPPLLSLPAPDGNTIIPTTQQTTACHDHHHHPHQHYRRHTSKDCGPRPRPCGQWCGCSGWARRGREHEQWRMGWGGPRLMCSGGGGRERAREGKRGKRGRSGRSGRRRRWLVIIMMDDGMNT